MYVSPNFKTKKALKEAIAARTTIQVYQPNNMFGVIVPTDGTVSLEGPHYPASHTWYANGTMQKGKLVKIS